MIKLDSVVTDVMGKAIRCAKHSSVANATPRCCAEMVLTRMRPKILEPRRALLDRCDEHHVLMST